MTSESFIKKTLEESKLVLEKTIESNSIINLIQDCINLMVNCHKNKNKIFSCGNGGSMCDATHFAEELTGKFKDDREPIAAMSINDPSHISCTSNDYGYEHIFSRYIEAWGKQNDILLAISTSGNSKNVINATKVSKNKGMKIIGLLGKGGGLLKNLVDYPIIIESQSTERIQEIHIKIIHIFIEGIERKLFPKNYS